MVTWSPPAFGPQRIFPNNCSPTDDHHTPPRLTRPRPIWIPCGHISAQEEWVFLTFAGGCCLSLGRCLGVGLVRRAVGAVPRAILSRTPGTQVVISLSHPNQSHLPHTPPHPQSDTTPISSPQIIWGHSLLKFHVGKASLSPEVVRLNPISPPLGSSATNLNV